MSNAGSPLDDFCTCAFCLSYAGQTGSEEAAAPVTFEATTISAVTPTADMLSLTTNDFSRRWNISTPTGTPVFVTYSFGNAKASYDSDAGRQTFVPWLPEQMIEARKAMEIWAAASGIVFLEVPDAEIGQIRISIADLSGSLNSVGQQVTGYAYYPGYTTSSAGVVSPSYDTIGGDIFLHSGIYGGNSAVMAPGARGFSVLLHEIGHSLGFKHPFEGTPTIDPARDNASYTVLSYNRPNATTALGSVDIQALQFYYGSTDSGYAWNPATLTLVIHGTAGADVRIGTELTDHILGGAGDDDLRAGPGDDILHGEDGNDLFQAGRGNDTFDGGAGLDRIVMSSSRAAYTLGTFTQAGGVTTGAVTDRTANRDGVDALINIERLQFTDGTLAFDTAGTAGQVYRLYQAAFARTPDTGGLKHNVGLVDGGLSLQQMSSAFLASAEFQQKYGSDPTDSAYINALYRNVLGRDADPAGLSGWQGRLNDGSWTRTTLLIGFSESPENIAKVAAAIANGIWLA